MNLIKIVSDIKNWENKISEKYPLKTILAICIIVILYQLSTISSDLRSIKSDLWSIESDVSSIESDVSSIERDVSSIESNLQH